MNLQYAPVLLLLFCMLLAIGPTECSITLDTSAETKTSITVRWMWTNCMGTEPSRVSLRWSPAHSSGSAIDISTAPASYEIRGLKSGTSYTIMAFFTDACGTLSAETNTATLPDVCECKFFIIYVTSNCKSLGDG